MARTLDGAKLTHVQAHRRITSHPWGGRDFTDQTNPLPLGHPDSSKDIPPKFKTQSNPLSSALGYNPLEFAHELSAAAHIAASLGENVHYTLEQAADYDNFIDDTIIYE